MAIIPKRVMPGTLAAGGGEGGWVANGGEGGWVVFIGVREGVSHGIWSSCYENKCGRTTHPIV